MLLALMFFQTCMPFVLLWTIKEDILRNVHTVQVKNCSPKTILCIPQKKVSHGDLK